MNKLFKNSWILGNENVFIYWDKKASVLEVNIFEIYVHYWYMK